MTVTSSASASPARRCAGWTTRSGLCVGCARTLDEIASWSVLDDDARRAIVAALPARKASLASAPGGRR
jgi:predicted Fe-S protein YdhL (DUF1289 family)